MFGEDVFSEYEEIVTVHTTNKELENKIKELEFNRSISFGSNMGVGAFDFICDNINVDKKDKYQVYAQFMDNKYGNKIEEYDSYIYSNDYETLVLDLINAMYKSGFVTLCASDIRSCLKNKSFNHYKYIIHEPLTPKLLNKILNEFDMNNKECILICHGNNDIAYMEFNILW